MQGSKTPALLMSRIGIEFDGEAHLSNVEAEEAASEIERLEAEVARCHERLEIDHYWKLGDNDDLDLERVEIPMEERASFPDAVAARDATIELAEDRASAAEAQRDKLKEVLGQISGLDVFEAALDPEWAILRAREALASIEGEKPDAE